MKDILTVVMFPIWFAALCIGVTALVATAIIFIFLPLWWSQCQIVGFIFDKPFTWGCF